MGDSSAGLVAGFGCPPSFSSEFTLDVTGVIFLLDGMAGFPVGPSVALVAKGGDLSGVFTEVSLSEVAAVKLLLGLDNMSSVELLRIGEVWLNGGDVGGLVATIAFGKSCMPSDG